MPESLFSLSQSQPLPSCYPRISSTAPSPANRSQSPKTSGENQQKHGAQPDARPWLNAAHRLVTPIVSCPVAGSGAACCALQPCIMQSREGMWLYMQGAAVRSDTRPETWKRLESCEPAHGRALKANQKAEKKPGRPNRPVLARSHACAQPLHHDSWT